MVSISLNVTRIVEGLKQASEHTYKYETLQEQILWRDICFVVDANKDFDALIKAVRAVPEVQDLEVFDVYAGSNLGEDKKSVSIKIKIIGNPAKAGAGGSMTSDQINEVINKAIKAGETTGASLRS